MDRNIQIEIRDRIAYLNGNPKIICGNNDYKVTFTFDDEWAGIDVKTLRVSYNNKYSDHVFSGDVVNLPQIVNAVEVYLGVFAGDITSTKVAVRAEPSILCAGGSVADPEPDVYNQIINLINAGMSNGDSGESYTLPTASETVKGGVMVGDGLEMDGEKLKVKPEGVYELIETVTLEEDAVLDRTAEPDSTPYSFRAVTLKTVTTGTLANAVRVYYSSGDTYVGSGYYASISSAATRYKVDIVEQVYGYWRTMWSPWNTNPSTYGSGMEYCGQNLMNVYSTDEYPAITRIKSNAALPAGTTIEIWGVRA